MLAQSDEELHARSRRLLWVRFFICAAFISCDALFWHMALERSCDKEACAFFLGEESGTALFMTQREIFMENAGTSTVSALLEILPTKAYIDLAFISTPTANQFSGYDALLDRYSFGAFAYNGRMSDASSSAAWQAFQKELAKRQIPLITLSAGDQIIFRDGAIKILEPDGNFAKSPVANEANLVMQIAAPMFSTILAGPISLPEQRSLSKENPNDLHVNVLNLSGRFPKNSLDPGFLLTIKPDVVIFGITGSETTNFASEAAIAAISSTTDARIFRTDQDGTLAIFEEGGGLRVERRDNSP